MFGLSWIKSASRAWFFIMLAAVCLGLAGCTCDQDPSLKKIKQAGQIRIAMSAGYSPFSFYGNEKELVGFDVDVARELAKRLGVELKIVDTPWEGIIEGLRTQRYDCILGSMSITEARQALVNFSTPYYYSRIRLMVHTDSPFKNQAELKDKMIGLTAGTTFEREAGRIGARHIRHYPSDDEALSGLHKGEVDAVITDEVVGSYAASRKKFRIKNLGPPLGEEKIAAAFRKDDKALLTGVNHALQAMQNDGTLRRLMEKMVREGY